MQGIQDRLEDVGSRLGPFADAFEAVQREIREKFKQSSQHHGVWVGLQGFAHAVKWTVSDSHTPLLSLPATFYLPDIDHIFLALPPDNSSVPSHRFLDPYSPCLRS